MKYFSEESSFCRRLYNTVDLVLILVRKVGCRLPIQLAVAHLVTDSVVDSLTGCRFRCRLPIPIPIQLLVADSVTGCR